MTWKQKLTEREFLFATVVFAVALLHLFGFADSIPASPEGVTGIVNQVEHLVELLVLAVTFLGYNKGRAIVKAEAQRAETAKAITESSAPKA